HRCVVLQLGEEQAPAVDQAFSEFTSGSQFRCGNSIEYPPVEVAIELSVLRLQAVQPGPGIG
ncbi:hypothetical protein K4H00_26905, partial [Mycobacterium tuberculosis]|nr:hypothetical protein [Mycobacterium tuberculosis]